MDVILGNATSRPPVMEVSEALTCNRTTLGPAIHTRRTRMDEVSATATNRPSALSATPLGKNRASATTVVLPLPGLYFSKRPAGAPCRRQSGLQHDFCCVLGSAGQVYVTICFISWCWHSREDKRRSRAGNATMVEELQCSAMRAWRDDRM